MSALLAVPDGPAGSAPDPLSCYLHPGKVAVFGQPAVISTILGSCVAMCLWDEAAGLGGMNHFLLPEVLSGSRSPRFAQPAFEALCEQLYALGALRSQLRAKLFGGAALGHGRRGEASIGERNVEVARRLLAEAGIAIVAEDVGGDRGRKLVFETRGGQAWVRMLREQGA